jgi:hypothetical protein
MLPIFEELIILRKDSWETAVGKPKQIFILENALLATTTYHLVA